MNERISELGNQAWDYALYHETVNGKAAFNSFINKNFSDLLLEKFAELIVRECIDIAYEYDAPKMSGPGMIIGNRIEAHFGVGMSVEDKKTLIKELLGVKND